MNRLCIAAVLVFAIVGCSGEADKGINKDRDRPEPPKKKAAPEPAQKKA